MIIPLVCRSSFPCTGEMRSKGVRVSGGGLLVRVGVVVSADGSLGFLFCRDEFYLYAETWVPSCVVFMRRKKRGCCFVFSSFLLSPL